MKRGDVVIAATGGGYGGKPRPYIVVQADTYPTHNVVLVGCTTTGERQVEIRPILTPSVANGLTFLSEVMIDLPIAARRDKIAATIGALSVAEIDALNRAMVSFFGLDSV